MWYSIGVTYGIMYEKFPLPLAFRFALGAMAASGVPPPVCMHVDGYYDCQLGNVFNMICYVFCFLLCYGMLHYNVSSHIKLCHIIEHNIVLVASYFMLDTYIYI